MSLYVKIKLIVCLGDCTNTNNFFAFSSIAKVSSPVPRGEVVMCPVNKHVSIPAIVSEARVGGDEAILVVYSDETPDQDLLDAFRYSKKWVSRKPASSLRGEAVGVFADEEMEDLVPVESWPEWQHEELQVMISLGFLDSIHQLEILLQENISTEVMDDEGKIIKIDNWQNNKDS